MNPFRFARKSDRRVLAGLAVVVLFGLGVLLGRHWDGLVGPPASLSPASSAQQATNAGSDGARPATNEMAETAGGQAQPHVFDPNTADSLTLTACGVESWKVHTFLRYRQAGKRFYDEADLLDTYGWTDEDLRKLRPYLRFGARDGAPASLRTRNAAVNGLPAANGTSASNNANGTKSAAARPSASSSSPLPEKFTSHTWVDVNAADTTLLRRIPGIGSYYARQVVRLRDRLGGFTHVEQLLEIRDFPVDALDWLQVTNSQPVRRIRLTDSVGDLARHPYIGYKRARALAQYQQMYGAITDSASLAATRLFAPDELRLLLPYISF